MKKLIYFILVISMVACTEKEQKSACSISGTSLNNPAEFLLLTEGRNSDTILLNEDGSYAFIKDMDRPGSYYLRSDKNYIPVYLAPDADLIVNFDMESFDESISFEGGLALENKYKQKNLSLSGELSKKTRELYTALAEDYKSGIESIKNEKEALLDEFYTANPEMSEEFVKSEKLSLQFSNYSSLLNYEAIYKYYAKVEEIELPEDWYSFLDDIKLDNPEYMNVPACLSVVQSIINRKTEEETGLGNDDYGTVEILEAHFDYVIANVESQELINYFLNSYLGSHIDGRGTAGIENTLTLFYEKNTNEKEKEGIKEKAAEWAHLNPGMPAPEFSLPDISGKIYSLSDFKGKYVYIDFWATWCGPCMTEIPFLEKLTEDYKDSNIEIISISVDKDKQAWFDMVTKDEPQWLQLHDSINMNDEYLVKFIPSFILIDMDGKIIAPRAIRPSSGEELENLFNSLEGLL